MQIYYPLTIDLNQVGLIPTVKAKQGDSGRGLIATLTNAGQVVDATGNSCRIYGKKPDGTVVYATCTVVEGGKVQADFTTQLLAVVGTVQIELEMQMGNDVVTTPILNLVVMPTNIDDNAVESADEFSVLQGLVSDFTGRASGIETDIADLKSDLSDVEALIAGGGAGLKDAVKSALLACFQNVAWVNANGQTYYDELESALYDKEVVSITATFTQGANVVYDVDSLEDLKTYLTVTARYDDASSATITGYTLSGTLTPGTSTITVTYLQKTATFNVTVTDYLSTINFEANAWARNGYAAGGYPEYVKASVVAARARCTAPFENHGYVFTVTDGTLYNIIVYNITSDQTEYVLTAKNTYDYCYPGTSNSKSWGESGSSTGEYVLIGLKKMDNTEFTQLELSNAYGTIFTATKNN